MSDDLLMAIRFLEGITVSNPNYSFVYLFTNENIKGFIDKLFVKDKKILTVCSSGDQAFNLILNGAKKIDLFDINIFTKYYFYLKKSAIECLSYDEFLNFFFPKFLNNNDFFSFDTYLNIRKFIEYDEIKKFWDYLFCHYSNKNIYNSIFFTNSLYSKSNTIFTNDYLSSEDNYNKLKELLDDKKFNFYNINIFKDKISSDKKFDLVYLSNIFDYLCINNKLDYANKVKEIIVNLGNNVNLNGIIAVSYLYLYCDDYWDVKTSGKLKSKEIRAEYFDNGYEYINFPGACAPRDNQLRNKDALMLYRKK